MLNAAVDTSVKYVVIIGDINADFSTPAGVKLEQLCSKNNLIIHNFEPPRIVPGSASILDNVWTNADTVDSVNLLAPAFNSDHCVLWVSLKFNIVHSVPFERKAVV